MIKIQELDILCSKKALETLPSGKLLINTINAFSYNNARKDKLFAEALTNGDVLIPDGISIVHACHFLNAKSKPEERIAGWDLFYFEMQKAEREAIASGKRKAVMFMGSSPKVLKLIVENAHEIYPHLDIVTYSPPYKPEFSDGDNAMIITAINDCNPDLLWIGMTAPKQEKWAYQHWEELNIHCHCGTIGAVFDFFACTARRAPQVWQNMGLEWLFRLMVEPRRLWRRYMIGNVRFLWYIMQEKFAR